MRKRILPVILLTFVALCPGLALSQASISSSTGYTVTISIQPISIVPSTYSCQYGYNYNVTLNYVVNFSGSNIPASLYTLQGTLGCGADSHFYDLPNNGGTGTITTISNVWNPNSDCATATPATLLCNNASIQIEGPGIAAQTVNFTLASGGPLAITLGDFNAEAVKDKVKLNWFTVTESNNDYFSVERSTDGINWNLVKTLKGAINSATILNYECFDEQPVTGTLYYRLKQTDLDGKFSYSATKRVKFTTGDNIFMYPVPNTGNTINFKGIQQPQSVLLHVYDVAGNSVYSTALTSNSVTLPIIKPGTYTISLVNKSNGVTTKLRYVKL